MNVRSLFALLAVSALSASTALAQCTESTKQVAAKEVAAKGDGHCTGTSAELASADGECNVKNCEKASTCCSASIAQIAKSAGVEIPKISYQVGEKQTCCPMEAEKIANGDKSTIKFVVAEKTYDTEGEAKTALAGELDSFRTKVMTVQYAVGDERVGCPVTAESIAKKSGKAMKYRVVAYDFNSREDAEKAIKLASAAADKVGMQMKVGDKAYNCPVTAAEVAQKEGKTVEYCVGEKSSPCKQTASLELATARLQAAFSALAEAAQG